MIEVRQTPTFKAWLDDLSDLRAVERIAQRLVRLQAGMFGDVKPVGSGVSELVSIMVQDIGFTSLNVEKYW